MNLASKIACGFIFKLLETSGTSVTVSGFRAAFPTVFDFAFLGAEFFEIHHVDIFSAGYGDVDVFAPEVVEEKFLFWVNFVPLIVLMLAGAVGEVFCDIVHNVHEAFSREVCKVMQFHSGFGYDVVNLLSFFVLFELVLMLPCNHTYL